MTAQDFMLDFLAGRIATPFRVSEDGLSIIDGREKTITTFPNQAETQSFTDSVSKAIKAKFDARRRGTRRYL